MYTIVLALCLDAVGYFALAMYLDQVFPKEFGVSRHPFSGRCRGPPGPKRPGESRKNKKSGAGGGGGGMPGGTCTMNARICIMAHA
mgnify:CR=1 FL=1